MVQINFVGELSSEALVELVEHLGSVDFSPAVNETPVEKEIREFLCGFSGQLWRIACLRGVH